MGPFKTVGGLRASGGQIAIFYRGTAIALAHTTNLKSRLGISVEGEAPQESRCRTDFWKHRRCARAAFIILLAFRSGNGGDLGEGTDDQIAPKSVEIIGPCPFLSGSN